MIRDATEILARDHVRECARMARIAAELIETGAMTASPGALEGALRVLRESTTQAIGSFKQMRPAIEPAKKEKADANGG